MPIIKEALECLPLGITISDVDGKIVYANPAQAEMHGYHQKELLGREARALGPRYLWKPLPAEKIRTIGLWRRESVNVRRTGEEFPVHLCSNVIKDSQGESIGIVTSCEDISLRKEAERTIKNLAYHDPLTGLPNRGTLLDRLNQALGLGHREGRPVGLLFLDLDNFKEINDTQGHAAGDSLLRELAARLSLAMRESDTLARIGGDEFVVVLTVVDSKESLAAVAERVISNFDDPFLKGTNAVSISVSIGIALYPDEAEDAEALLQCADAAMYEAKKVAGSAYQFYSPVMNDRILRRSVFETGFRDGLEKEQFSLRYQPQWDLRARRISGVEALLRWQSPDFGLLLPGEFVPLAEKSGMISRIEEWVLRRACLQGLEWSSAGHRLKVSVNISCHHLKQPHFLEMVDRVFDETGIDPCMIELEFSEKGLMEKPEAILGTLLSLKETGVGLTVDHFGNGYSSLKHLKKFPIDRIKIDPSFVAGLGRNHDDLAIVDAIVSMGHRLDLKVAAEGVERPEQLDLVISRCCDEAQGFFLSQPLTDHDVAEMLAERQLFDWLGVFPQELTRAEGNAESSPFPSFVDLRT